MNKQNEHVPGRIALMLALAGALSCAWAIWETIFRWPELEPPTLRWLEQLPAEASEPFTPTGAGWVIQPHTPEALDELTAWSRTRFSLKKRDAVPVGEWLSLIREAEGGRPPVRLESFEIESEGTGTIRVMKSEFVRIQRTEDGSRID